VPQALFFDTRTEVNYFNEMHITPGAWNIARAKFLEANMARSDPLARLGAGNITTVSGI